MLVHHDAAGVAAVGHGCGAVLVGRVVGENGVRAELLEVRGAARAFLIRIDEAADSHDVADLVLGHRGADLRHAADNLMPRHTGIGRGHGAPFVADLMQVGMADAAVQDVDLHISLGRFATWNTDGSKG